MVINNKILVPKAREGLNKLKVDVMKQQGYHVLDDHPDNIKFEIADELGIPLSKENNGQITARNAGKIGGSIGGNMVKEMVKTAQQQMVNSQNKK